MAHFRGKSVAIVGSGPGSLDNEVGFVDSHDAVVRINNFKTSEPTGFRTDCFYSFHGGSIKKSADDLKRDGVKLLICKCPNANLDKVIDSQWHRDNNKMLGVDFRYIYETRKDWWFAPTYVPSVEEFMASFNLLGRHIPTTGFAALLAVLECEPARTFVTGMDFFSSGIHNVNEPWQKKNNGDPIGHVPEVEQAWLAKHLDRVTMDKRLTEIMGA